MSKPRSDADLKNQVEQYASVRPMYESYAAKLKTLLISLLEAHNLKYQVVESRAKEVLSFQEKITRAGKSYENPISDLSDLCGARIIVYYSDDVDKVAKMLVDEFSVVEHEGSHQQDAFDADRFGYLSIHYVVKLNKNRQKLAEWKFANDFRAEVQVRTVIQHAWSAVSHALQYKQETAIPSRLRRRLFRIAGLFELADEEFVGIRDAKGQLIDAAAKAFAAGDKSIPITSESLIELIANEKAMQPILGMAHELGITIEDGPDEDTALPEIYELSKRLGFSSIGDIISIIEEDQRDLFLLIKKGMPENWYPPKDFLVFFAMLKKAGGIMKIRDLEDFGWSDDRAELILSAAEKAR